MIAKMRDKRIIIPPFFELGPKAYLYGNEFLELAKHADQLSIKYDVDIVLTPQTVDIPTIVKETENVFVFAQHMDYLKVGRGMGSVLPEALKAAGAEGVLLNHVEKRLSMKELEKTIKRGKEVDLMTLVCTDNVDDAVFVAKMNPTFIVVESPDMIGTGERATDENDDIEEINRILAAISPEILVLHGAGISNGQDVYDVIFAGAQGTGSSSGVMLADNRFKILEEMISAVHRAWTEKHKN
jgi:triosephosphate isomerase